MGIISYAQNFEDIMLWRALNHVERGFYIDVGANHPTIESVTKLFYENGWSGINIEPVDQWFAAIQAERLRDTNLKIALGAEAGELTLYDLSDTGLCTFDKTIAERHEKERGYKKRHFTIEQRTLTDVCNELSVSEIHFLKVDVEGAELNVMRGFNLEKYRPWILVVEATLPNSKDQSYEAWDALIVEAGYEFVYFDGLNRFYTSVEKSNELRPHFNRPPNVFDEFKLATLENAHVAIDALNQKINAANNLIQDYKQTNLELNRQLDDATKLSQDYKQTNLELNRQLDDVTKLSQDYEQVNRELNQSNHHWYTLYTSSSHQLQDVYASVSWRITAPLRIVFSLLPQQAKRIIGLPFRAIIFVLYPLIFLCRLILRPFVASPSKQENSRHTRDPGFKKDIVAWAMAKPFLVRFVHAVVDFVPPLQCAIKNRVARAMDEQPGIVNEKVESSQADEIKEKTLSTRACQVYTDLKAAKDAAELRENS